MKQTTISLNDLQCLEHLRNVGQLVTELSQDQACTTLRCNPEQQHQLNSLIYLMTTQLEGVVERCNQHWLTGEGSV